MCTTCGCSGKKDSANKNQVHQHDHVHSRLVEVEQDLLNRNDRYAAQNRTQLKESGVLALNLVSSPGAGKTSLLVETIKALNSQGSVAVIEGDQQTDRDAQRIAATGAPSHQLNTGKGCHLDAHSVGHALEHFNLKELETLFIENVGNLVCPAAFDLGEYAKVVVLSVTEGDDKPLKYPDMFKASTLMLINKIDLLPHVDFDLEQAIDFARRINPSITIIKLSAKSGEGMDEWLAWIEQVQKSLSEGTAYSANQINDTGNPQVNAHEHG